MTCRTGSTGLVFQRTMSSASANAGEDNHVFVVDDDRSVRRALGRLLKSAGYCVESFESAEQFLESGYIGHAGCVIVDLQMPGISGLELQHRLIEEMVDMPVVFLTGHGDIPTSVQAMKDGAIDFLTKPVEADRLFEVVPAALRLGAERRVRTSEIESIRERATMLTPRETEVMHLVASGRLNKQIAFELGTSEKTIKVHRARVMEKMRVSSVAELVRLVDRLAGSSQT